MSDKEVCIPLKNRKPNEVDSLEAKIELIRKNCNHDFRFAEKSDLSESLVKDVFVGDLASRAEEKVSPSKFKMTLVCLKCNKTKEAHPFETCPRCLGLMRREYCLGAGSRERYFGNKYLYYSIALSRCPKCGLVIANDEWDQ